MTHALFFLYELTLRLRNIDMFVDVKTHSGSTIPKAYKKVLGDIWLSSFKIVQDRKRHSNPTFPQTLKRGGHNSINGKTQQNRINKLIFEVIRMNKVLSGGSSRIFSSEFADSAFGIQSFSESKISTTLQFSSLLE